MTDYQKWLSGRYLTYKLLTNLWFVGAIWLYFYRLFITDGQVGILDGIAFAVGLIAEVPSGVLADKFGRDKMAKFGQIMAGSGLLIQAFGSSLTTFMFGQAVMMIGVSFVSGADEALFFDKLKFSQTSLDWRKLVTRASQISLIASMSAVIIGGWIYNIDHRLPWILNGLSFIGSAMLIWSINETKTAAESRNLFTGLKEHILSIRLGFMEFGKPKLALYVPIIITVQGLFYTAGWGLLRLVLLDRFHFSPVAGSFVIASCSLITVIILAFMHRHAENISEKIVLVLISLLDGMSLLLSLGNIGMWGYFVILALYAGEHILHPFMSEIINYHTENSRRATVLSVSSFLRTLPYVVLAPVIGYLNTQNRLGYFFIFWTLLIGAAVVIYLSAGKKDNKLSLVKDEPVDARLPVISPEG